MLSAGVALDVTSFISAQDFIVSQNRLADPADPFARDCYVEVVQSLIFQPSVWVLHPTSHNPTIDDFGSEPLLLRQFLRHRTVAPLQLTPADVGRYRAAETAILSQLRSRGSRVLTDFVDQTLLVDSQHERHGSRRVPLAAKLSEWSSFQSRQVRSVPDHHSARIRTTDGIEDDPLGDWSRHFADIAQGQLEPLAGDADPKYIVAQLVRGLRYDARANARRVHYQAHPMRRDFTLAYDMSSEGIPADRSVELIRGVRGIYDDLADAVPRTRDVEMKLIELELPLLGGRVWRSAERGRQTDRDWIRLVADRIVEYRHRATEFRQQIASCSTEMDQLRLQRQFRAVAERLAVRLGVATAEPPTLERDLVAAVDSVVPGLGLPKVGGVVVALRAIGKRSRPPREPVQRFLYREFSEAFKRARQ